MAILLHDSVHWVKAKVSKVVEGYFKSGLYEVGDIVDVVKSIGAAADLLIVSVHFCIVLFQCNKNVQIKLARRESLRHLAGLSYFNIIPLIPSNITEGSLLYFSTICVLC